MLKSPTKPRTIIHDIPGLLASLKTLGIEYSINYLVDVIEQHVEKIEDCKKIMRFIKMKLDELEEPKRFKLCRSTSDRSHSAREGRDPIPHHTLLSWQMFRHVEDGIRLFGHFEEEKPDEFISFTAFRNGGGPIPDQVINPQMLFVFPANQDAQHGNPNV